ncbi:uncharacterized protein LOC144798275 [Lissotriton helveticus]
MTSPKAPANHHELKEFDSVKESIADIINQLQDIDPSRLSFSPFLDLDTQISMAPVSDSPESSVEELHSTSEEVSLDIAVGELPARSQSAEEVRWGTRGAEAGGNLASEDAVGQRGTNVGKGESLVVLMPQESCFLDDIRAEDSGVMMASETVSSSPGGEDSLMDQRDLDCFSSDPLMSGEEHPFLGPSSDAETVELVSQRSLPASSQQVTAQSVQRCHGCTSAHLKAIASVFVSLLMVPWMLYGLYVYLPFEPPFCPDVASRAAFTTRCLVISLVPVMLGVIWSGLSRLCSSTVDPLDMSSRSVLLHQCYITSSVEQFIIYSVNMLALAMSLEQEHLRLIPILAGLFSVGRCCYWIALRVGRSYSGFGFGLTFFPALAMTGYNLYCFYKLGFDFNFRDYQGESTGHRGTTRWPALGSLSQVRT